MMQNAITVEVLVEASLEKVWACFTNPEAITVWNTASEDWHTTHAENDLSVGGIFLYRMEAKDGTAGFDFNGVYDDVVREERIAYTMEGGRKVEISFVPEDGGVRVTETFEPETENTHELQRSGWQAILDSFKKYTESSS